MGIKDGGSISGDEPSPMPGTDRLVGMEPPVLDAAMVYEELLVPGLFAPWARVVAEEARLKPGARVLDVACGTGALARAAARVAGGEVVGLDLDEGMLAVAAGQAPGIHWTKASAEAIPLRTGTFDAVVSQFGLMFFPDPGKALQEMLRTLVPGGRLVLAVWDALERSPLFAELDAIYLRHLGEGAREALRAPFVLGAPQRLAGLLEAAGSGMPRIHTHRVKARFPSVEALVRADLEGWMPRAHVGFEPRHAASILQEAHRALRPFLTPEGRLEGEVSAHLATVVKPEGCAP